MKVPFYIHNLGQEEKTAVVRALDLPFLTTGSLTGEFEKALANYMGSEYAVGLMSCTAALHLALLACGVGPGDEVITTPMTFAATSLAIIHCGAKPVWIDVDSKTGNMDVTKIANAVTSKTKAILPVHLYGQMCDMEQIHSVAQIFGLKVIEDAAHALESSYRGVHVGALSDAACFSFYTTKAITCGEGGALTTNSLDIYNTVKCLRSHGMSLDAASRYEKKYVHWDLLDFGWKYNMDNIKASLLIPQIEHIEERRLLREKLYNQYMLGLSTTKGLSFPDVLPDSVHGHHLFTFWVEPTIRDAFMNQLQDLGVGCAVNYTSLNLLSKFLTTYGLGEGSFPNSEKIGKSTITLPLYPKLSIQDVEYVISCVVKLAKDLL